MPRRRRSARSPRPARSPRSARGRRSLWWIGPLVAVVALGIGVIVSALNAEEPPQTSATATPTAEPTVTPTPNDERAQVVADVSSSQSSLRRADRTALEMLDDLAVKGRAPKTGYTRDEFGQRWADVDRNGCDTRNDVLAEQLRDVERSGPCKVVTGVLHDPFTATVIDFVRGQGTSELVQIDHVVALSDAWQKGAQQLTLEQRTALANDPLNLLAVDGEANAQKSDGDAATWLPANKAFRCEYVARQVSVKAAYGLWVTEAERDAIARVLAGCPDQPGYLSEYAETVIPTPTPTPTPTVEPAPAPAEPVPFVQPSSPPAAPPAAPPPTNVYYDNCDAVRAAGKAPIYAGDPGYSRKLDRDGDGVGCE